MKKTNKFKEFFKGYGNMFSDLYDHLSDGETDPGISIIFHGMTWLGTAALTTLTVTAISAGAVVPAILWGLATATVATDEIVHLKKGEPPFLAKTLSNLVTGILAPVTMAVLYPVAAAAAAISNSVKEHRQAKKEAKASKDYTTDYFSSTSHEATADEIISTPSTTEAETTRHAPDFSNYYMEGEPRPSAGQYIEELEDPDFKTPPTDDNTSGSDPV